MAADYQTALDAYNRYMAMIQGGVAPVDAVQQSGLVDLKQQQLREQAKAQQKGQFGQIGGMLAGALGTKALTDVMQGKPALGELRTGLSNLFGGTQPVTQSVATAAPTSVAGATTVAPVEIVGAQRAPAPTGTFAPGSTLSTALGGAGAALGAYGAYKGIENKDPLSAGLGGAGVAGGLSTMGLTLGPLGWAGLIAAPALGALINKMGDKDRWKEEYDRKKKLVEQGIIPEFMLGEAPSKGRSQEELVALEEQKVAAGQYGNPDFARTRDVALLRPQDIWGFSVAPETIGKDYMAASEEQRLAFNQKLLNEGLVSEAKGQISYKDPKRAKEIWNEITGKTV